MEIGKRIIGFELIFILFLLDFLYLWSLDNLYEIGGSILLKLVEFYGAAILNMILVFIIFKKLIVDSNK